MRKIASLPILSMLGCSPLEPKPLVATPMAVEIDNNYAESIFTIDLTADGGTVRAADSVRVTGYGTQSFPKVMSVNVGDPIAVAADIVSLGQHTQFTAMTSAPSSNRTLVFIYDYDLALATFRLTYKWSY